MLPSPSSDPYIDYLSSVEGLQLCRTTLERVAATWVRVILRTRGFNDSAVADRAVGLSALTRANAMTAKAIARVGDDWMWTQDAFVLGRALLERQLNCSFLACCDLEEYRSIETHAQQRRFRDLSQASGPPGARWSYTAWPAPVDPSTIPGMQEALDQFTSRKGLPKSWTDRTFDNRVAYIVESEPGAMADLFSLAHLRIYRVSSEIVHGSLYGALSLFSDAALAGSAGEAYDWAYERTQLASLYALLLRTSGVVTYVLRARVGNSEAEGMLTDVLEQLNDFFEPSAQSAEE